MLLCVVYAAESESNSGFSRTILKILAPLVRSPVNEAPPFILFVAGSSTAATLKPHSLK